MIPIPSSGFIVIVIFWLLVYLVDSSIKKSRTYNFRYTESLRDNGFSISPAHIRWQTPMFNKLFLKFGRMRPKLLLYWFNLGAIFGCVSMILSVVLLTGMLYKSFKEKHPEQVLQPVMPGMNLPWNQVVYYLFTLIVAGSFHEIGHAIAAVRENVRVNSFGLFVLIVYPGAFVELHTDQLDIITPVRKLRIYTAGVWHNFVLAVAALVFSTSLSYLLLPFYAVNQGVSVTWISEKSSIASNLPIGDVITSVNHCPVKTSKDWYDCIEKIQTNRVEGYCNSDKHIRTHNTSLPILISNYNEPDCCNDTSAYRFCFFYEREKFVFVKHKHTVEAKSNKLVRTSGEYISTFREHACLPARSTITYKQTCLNNRGCTDGYFNDMLCLKPLTLNVTKLISIAHNKGQDVLFVGNPSELISYIALSNYIPKHIFTPLTLPEHLNTFAMYLLSISSALAVLNMVPCFFLDGHQTLSALLELLVPDKPVFRSLVEPVILICGSLLLGLNIIFALYSLVS